MNKNRPKKFMEIIVVEDIPLCYIIKYTEAFVFQFAIQKFKDQDI